jgi:acyl-CoA thioesterase II
MTGKPDSLEFLTAVVGVEVVDDATTLGRTDFGVVERGGLFGGQMISQALASCAHTVRLGSVPDSIHADLLGGGSSGEPIEFRVETVRDGGALQHRDVRGYQKGALMVHATVVAAMPVSGADWQADSAPVPEAPTVATTAPPPMASSLGWGAFEVVHPDGHEAGVDSWHPLCMRSVSEIPADPWLHGAVIAFWSDYGMNGAARVTHAEVAEPVSSVSATHSLWIHRRTLLRDWHILDAETLSLSGNQGFVRATLSDHSGGLVASIAQGVFIRRPRP